MTHIDRSALATELASLRSDVDGLAQSLKLDQGEAAEVTVRAEELSAAIQRLEWAITRTRPGPVVETQSVHG